MRMHKYRLFVVGFVVFAFFLAGIVVGRITGTRGVDDVTRLLRDNELNQQSFLLEQELVTAVPDCAVAKQRLGDLKRDLFGIGQRIITAEPGGLLGDDFGYLKVKYHLQQIRTFLLMKQFAQRCDIGPVVLFYYGDDVASRAQGKVLDEFGARYQATVLAVEYNFSEDLHFMESIFNVTGTPTIIVNYQDRRKGLVSLDVIENLTAVEKRT